MEKLSPEKNLRQSAQSADYFSAFLISQLTLVDPP
jgi:hypothetical protein